MAFSRLRFWIFGRKLALDSLEPTTCNCKLLLVEQLAPGMAENEVFHGELEAFSPIQLTESVGYLIGRK